MHNPVIHRNSKTAPCGSRLLLLDLFVDRLGTAPFTKLFEFNFTLHQLLIFRRPVVYALAFGAGQLYESVL